MFTIELIVHLSLKLINKCYKFKPRHWRAHWFRGIALMMLKRKKEALASFKTALKYAPKGFREDIQEDVRKAEK